MVHIVCGCPFRHSEMSAALSAAGYDASLLGLFFLAHVVIDDAAPKGREALAKLRELNDRLPDPCKFCFCQATHL